MDSLMRSAADGTLGLLFLTDLRGWDVVPGKMFTGSLRVFFGWTSTVMPVPAPPPLMGGVTNAQFCQFASTVEHPRFLALGRHFFFRVVQSNGKSIFWTLFLLAIITIIPLIFIGVGGMNPVLSLLSPGHAMHQRDLDDWRGSRVGMVSALDRVRVGGVRDAADSRLTIIPHRWQDRQVRPVFARSVQRIQCGRSGQVSSDRASGKQPGVVAGQPKRLDADLPRDAGLHHHLAGDDHSDCCGSMYSDPDTLVPIGLGALWLGSFWFGST